MKKSEVAKIAELLEEIDREAIQLAKASSTPVETPSLTTRIRSILLRG